MILTFTLPVIERIANSALKQDPQALYKLGRIKDQVIEINCTDWQMQFFIVVTDSGLQLTKKAPSQINTLIKSTLTNFLQLLSKGANTSALFKHPADITGDFKNIEVLHDVFRTLDIDWEEQLSKYLGDGLAHKIIYHAKKTKKTAQKIGDSLSDNVTEYLHFEAKALPTKQQVELFYADIDTLKNDVDRAEKHLEQLLQKQGGSHD